MMFHLCIVEKNHWLFKIYLLLLVSDLLISYKIEVKFRDLDFKGLDDLGQLISSHNSF